MAVYCDDRLGQAQQREKKLSAENALLREQNDNNGVGNVGYSGISNTGKQSSKN